MEDQKEREAEGFRAGLCRVRGGCWCGDTEGPHRTSPVGSFLEQGLCVCQPAPMSHRASVRGDETFFSGLALLCSVLGSHPVRSVIFPPKPFSSLERAGRCFSYLQDNSLLTFPKRVSALGSRAASRKWAFSPLGCWKGREGDG